MRTRRHICEGKTQVLENRIVTREEWAHDSNLSVLPAGQEVSRRQFLQTSAAGVLFTALGIGRVAEVFAAENTTSSTGITPFTINIPQSALGDLKRRLDMTRWPNRQTVSDWSQDVPLDKARALIEYWRTQYDWRRAEKKINGFAQYCGCAHETEIKAL